MSSHIYLYGFDHQAFRSLIQGKDPEGISDLKQELEDPDMFDLDDPDLVDEVIDQAVTSGFSYEGLDEDETDVLDCAVFAMFKGESLAPRLGVQPLTRVPIGWDLIQALKQLSTSSAAKQIYDILAEGGRRLGDTNACFCDYMILDETETRILDADAREVVAKLEEASEDASGIAESLLDALDERRSKQMPVVMFF